MYGFGAPKKTSHHLPRVYFTLKTHFVWSNLLPKKFIFNCLRASRTFGAKVNQNEIISAHLKKRNKLD